MSDVKEAALEYMSRGLRIVPLKDKVPWNIKAECALSGWPDPEKFEVTAENYAKHFNGVTNGVGVITDTLADIDLDCAAARWIGPLIMPVTASFGRETATVSHLIYACAGGIKKDIQLPGKNDHIEIRASGGHQTMFPGSMHPKNELIEWRNKCEPTVIEIGDLQKHVNVLAVACIFAHFYEDGCRDNLITTLAHLLHKYLSMTETDIQTVCDAVMDFKGDADSARLHKASKTVRGLKKGKTKYPGLPKLTEFIGKEWSGIAGELLDGDIEAPIVWNEPEDVFNLHDVPPCPLHLFPDVIADPVRQIAAALEVPFESVLFPALVTTAWAGGARCQIKLKRNQDYIQPSILFAFVAAKSGMGKSPAANMITRSVFDFQSAAKKRYDEELAEWDELSKKEKGDIKKPTFTQFLITNYTIEGIIKANEVNQLGLLILMDELSPMFSQGGKYSGGVSTDEPQLCELYDGRAISKVRAGEDASIFISDSCGSVFGNIQPDILHTMVTDKNISLGLIARFGLSAMPKQVQQHGVDLAIDQKVIAKFFARIDALKSMFNGEASQKITFTLDDDAQKLFNAKHDEIIRSRDAAADPLATHIAKYPGLLGRIILVLWLLTAETAQVRTTAEGKERHWQGFENLVVPKEIVESAFVFLEYLQGHAEVWYEKAAQKPGAKEGLRIAKWLLENHPTSVTLRDVYRVKKLKLDKGSAALGLQWLDTMNWGNWEPNRKAAGPGGGRESASFEVNPRTAVFGTIGTGQSR